MGNKFEVWVWVHLELSGDDTYSYNQYWRGQSFIKAIYHLLKAKQKGYGCVKLEYR